MFLVFYLFINFSDWFSFRFLIFSHLKICTGLLGDSITSFTGPNMPMMFWSISKTLSILHCRALHNSFLRWRSITAARRQRDECRADEPQRWSRSGRPAARWSHLCARGRPCRVMGDILAPTCTYRV